MPSYPSKFTPAERKTFGTKLARLLVERGVTAAELAREASKQLPPSKPMGRDVITRYTTGRSIPTPLNLKAIAKVLNADPNMLLPRDYATRPGSIDGESTLSPQRARDVRTTTSDDGMMNLMVNVHLPRQIGWRIAQEIQTELDKMDGAKPQKK